MKSLLHFVATPSRCGYLPDEQSRLEYEIVLALSPAEYMARMLQGWRRFGNSLFRPQCHACNACRPLRVLADRFSSDRSMRRVRKSNEGVVRLEIGTPSATAAKLALYDRYHEYQSEAKDWPDHGTNDRLSYVHSFVDNPIPTEEWCYYLGNKLVGVGYVDNLPEGLSAIYFYYDPAERGRSLGTWNILNLLAEAKTRNPPHLYLGYYVEGCGSMLYKARFRPNQVREVSGNWCDYRV